MPKFPKVSKAHIINRKGEAFFRSTISDFAEVRRINEGDFGIDFEIELTCGGEACGNLARIQLKTHELAFINRNNFISESIKQETCWYWLEIPTPVFLVVADLGRKKIYWANAKSQVQNRIGDMKSRKTIKLLAPIKNNLIADPNFFIASVLYECEKILRQNLIPGYLFISKRFFEEMPNKLELDHFMFEEEPANSEIYLTQLLAVRNAFHLDNTKVKPFVYWLNRSRQLYGDGELLAYGVQEEMLIELLPYYIESLRVIKDYLGITGDTRVLYRDEQGLPISMIQEAFLELWESLDVFIESFLKSSSLNEKVKENIKNNFIYKSKKNNKLILDDD